ncbi:type IV pilin subunit protein, partial [Vibrio parahaemolyticus]
TDASVSGAIAVIAAADQVKGPIAKGEQYIMAASYKTQGLEWGASCKAGGKAQTDYCPN